MDMATFETLTASFPEPVCLLDENGMLIASNRAARRLFARHDTPTSLYDCVPQTDHARLKTTLQNWRRSTSPLPAAFNIKQADGSVSKCHVQGNLCQQERNGSPTLIMLRGKNTNNVTTGFRTLNDKIAQLEMQVAHRKKTEAALVQSQQSLQQAQAIAHIGSWNWDLVNDRIEMSDQAYRLIGKEQTDYTVTLESFTDLIHPKDRELFHQSVSNCMKDPELLYEVEFRLFHSDSSIHFFEARGEVIADESTGQPLQMLGTLHDITERKRTEEKIRQLNKDLEQRVKERTWELQATNNVLTKSLDELYETQHQLVESEKMAALGGLVAGIAHEINTPVGVSVTAASHLALKIKSYLQHYENNTLTREDFESLIKLASNSSNLILSNLERAADLIRSFKQIAVDQSSDVERQFNLKHYFAEVLLSLEPELKKYQPGIEINCDEYFELNSFPGAISQIFTNLIMNSLIHGFEGMEKQQGHITIDVAPADTLTTISYCDNGKGITEQQAKKIFEPFFTTKRNTGGSGLGMHIVYNLVNQTLGGNIECRSRPGEGACFLITIPHHATSLDAIAQ